MGDMRNWRKLIDEMFNDEIDSSAANRPADGEYEVCPVCNMEDENCKKCGGEGLIDITGEFKIPDFSKMKMDERNEHAKIKMTPADLTDPDDDGMVERPESEKDVKKHLKDVAKKYGVEFVADFEKYNNPKVKESKPYATMDDGPEDYLFNRDKKQKLVGAADPAMRAPTLEVGSVVEFENKGTIYHGVLKQIGDRFVRVQLAHWPEAPPIRINKKRVSKIDTNMSENTMDKDMKEMLRLAGMYVKPEVYEENTSGEESPLTNASDSVDAIRGEPKKKHDKFDNEDGEKSVLSENEEEWIEAVSTAMEYIDADHELVYDVAAANGQSFDNVRHMSWFIDEVAREVISQGLVGVPPMADEASDLDPMASYYSDDEEDFDIDSFDDDEFYVEESDGVDEDLLLKPKDAPGYDDEFEAEEEYSECGMSEDEGAGCKCSVTVYTEEAFYALQDEFGADLSFGQGRDELIVPCDQENVAGLLAKFGFRDGTDFETSDCVDEDLNNGYGKHHKVDGQDLFPSGETSNVTRDRGPAGAKHGDNPMYTRAKVKESSDLYESMKQAYRRHRLKETPSGKDLKKTGPAIRERAYVLVNDEDIFRGKPVGKYDLLKYLGKELGIISCALVDNHCPYTGIYETDDLVEVLEMNYEDGGELNVGNFDGDWISLRFNVSSPLK